MSRALAEPKAFHPSMRFPTRFESEIIDNPELRTRVGKSIVYASMSGFSSMEESWQVVYL